jgi:5-methylcytosine-specific restriction endonuclease McrA
MGVRTSRPVGAGLKTQRVETCRWCGGQFSVADMVEQKLSIGYHKVWRWWYCLPCDADARLGLTACPRCASKIHVQQFVHFDPGLPYKVKVAVRDLCTACHDALLQEYRRTCTTCGTEFFRMTPTPLCRACWSNTRLSLDPKREPGRVRSANRRAEQQFGPATLTVQEWKTTLDAFGWRCAYCQTGTFEALDHFIPLTARGDTTAGNCVPICTTCNSRKGMLDPSQCVVRGIFSFAAVERVRAYLVNGDLPTERRCTVTRDCGPRLPPLVAQAEA